jgi:putative YhdH/YhfP family quinone oxidoreductase
MKDGSFKALWVSETPDGQFTRTIDERSHSALPPGEVTIRVHYSSLNYKDALSATGNKGVTKSYPHIPGVDAGGVVLESTSVDFTAGDEVLVTAYEFGANAPGGWSELARVPSAWVFHRPEGLDLRDCMILGTAGFTAGLGVHKLVNHGVLPGQGPILVTGATGGVGCVAVSLLSQLGYTVEALTGKSHEVDFLHSLGAVKIVSRQEILEADAKPLLKGRWAGVMDTVGGKFLDSALRQTMLEGAVACCGNIGSTELHTSIYPFILRGIALYGAGSGFTPMAVRKEIWNKLGGPWRLSNLESIAISATLQDLDQRLIGKILEGGIRGRVVVSVSP